MARKRSKPRSFWEPWLATKSRSHGTGPPIVEGLPEEAAAKILEAWDRTDRDADWIVWGSGMTEPGIAYGYMSGKPVVTDDRQIIAVRRTLGSDKEAPTNEDLAKRMSSCVTAMAGVADPVEFMEDVRSLLLGYVQGECDDPREDVKVISLLGRCVPLNELEQVGFGRDE
jgi:hypothetical protein